MHSMLKISLAGYLPVIVLHGIFSDAAAMNDLVHMITTAHPGTRVYNIDGFDDLASVTENMWKQVYSFQKKMLPIFQNSTEGVNMICFSQGLAGQDDPQQIFHSVIY